VHLERESEQEGASSLRESNRASEREGAPRESARAIERASESEREELAA